MGERNKGLDDIGMDADWGREQGLLFFSRPDGSFPQPGDIAVKQDDGNWRFMPFDARVAFYASRDPSPKDQLAAGVEAYERNAGTGMSTADKVRAILKAMGLG